MTVSPFFVTEDRSIRLYYFNNIYKAFWSYWYFSLCLKFWFILKQKMKISSWIISSCVCVSVGGLWACVRVINTYSFWFSAAKMKKVKERIIIHDPLLCSCLSWIVSHIYKLQNLAKHLYVVEFRLKHF